MARFRDLGGGLYWSSCPDDDLLETLAKRGLGLIVDLTEEECQYSVPSGVDRVNYPIPDFSFRAFEGVLVKAVLPSLRYLESGRGVLVHCYGGIGRSGSTVAMILALRDGSSFEGVLRRLRRLGYENETLSQALAVRWFYRVKGLLDVGFLERLLLELEDEGYWKFLDHASSVAGVALDVLESLSGIYGFDRRDYVNAYLAGLLHDVGRVLGPEERHHEVGAEWVKSNPLLRGVCDVDIVSFAVYHHRRKTRLTEDPRIERLGVKAGVIAAAVRLGDAFKNAYAGEGTYVGTELRGSRLVIVINGHLNKSVDKRRIEEKAKALEELDRSIAVEVEEEL